MASPCKSQCCAISTRVVPSWIVPSNVTSVIARTRPATIKITAIDVTHNAGVSRGSGLSGGDDIGAHAKGQRHRARQGVLGPEESDQRAVYDTGKLEHLSLCLHVSRVAQPREQPDECRG